MKNWKEKSLVSPFVILWPFIFVLFFYSVLLFQFSSLLTETFTYFYVLIFLRPEAGEKIEIRMEIGMRKRWDRAEKYANGYTTYTRLQKEIEKAAV